MRRFLIGYLAVVLVAVALVAVLPRALPDRPAPAREAAAGAPVAEVATGSVEDLTAAILADLSAPASVKPAAPADPLAEMSAGVLAELHARRPGAALSADPALAALVARAVSEGQSPAYIDVLVNEAAGRGAVAVPPGLRRTDGRVDTLALLAALDPAGEYGEGDRGGPDFAADPVSAALDLGAATYVVLPGDSLSAIALRYYGDAGRYAEIYGANAEVLSGPDGLRAGQELVLPAR